jgi:sensor histidine kinase regulating citrate/malate metabolism
LGILLDNAIEECIESTGSSLAIKLSRNDELFSIIIKNTVRQSVKEKGIRAGVSTKGGHRGAGLSICQSILEKYDFITLNSYFVENSFVQNLVLYVSRTHG